MDRKSKWKKIIITANIFSIIAIISIILLHNFNAETPTSQKENSEKKTKHTSDMPKKTEMHSIPKIAIENFKFIRENEMPSDKITLTEQEQQEKEENENVDEVVVDYYYYNDTKDDTAYETTSVPVSSQKETYESNDGSKEKSDKETTNQKETEQTEPSNNDTESDDKKDKSDEPDTGSEGGEEPKNEPVEEPEIDPIEPDPGTETEEPIPDPEPKPDPEKNRLKILLKR